MSLEISAQRENRGRGCLRHSKEGLPGGGGILAETLWVMRQALQTPRKDLCRHKGRRCKGPEAERALGEQGDRAAEVSSKGRMEAKQVGEREGQGDRQRQVMEGGDLVWSLW